jgi:hypothetical protein
LNGRDLIVAQQPTQNYNARRIGIFLRIKVLFSVPSRSYFSFFLKSNPHVPLNLAFGISLVNIESKKNIQEVFSYKFSKFDENHGNMMFSRNIALFLNGDISGFIIDGFLEIFLSLVWENV